MSLPREVFIHHRITFISPACDLGWLRLSRSPANENRPLYQKPILFVGAMLQVPERLIFILVEAQHQSALLGSVVLIMDQSLVFHCYRSRERLLEWSFVLALSLILYSPRLYDRTGIMNWLRCVLANDWFAGRWDVGIRCIDYCWFHWWLLAEEFRIAFPREMMVGFYLWTSQINCRIKHVWGSF